MSVQTTITFPVRKKCSFYGAKEKIVKEDYSNATVTSTPSKYTPKVKKLVVLSSSESESESDVENNVVECNVKNTKRTNSVSTPRRTRKSSDLEGGHGSTPPKQKKTDIVNSSPTTPSTLLDRLNLSSPEEKKEQFVPKRLFASNKYREARKALHSCGSQNLPGREAELASLEQFIRKNLENETSASLYVSGPPGTGKTACLSKIMQQPEFSSKFKVVYVNCTTMKSAATIYAQIIQELGIGVRKGAKNSKALIERYLVTNHKMLLFILDEIDQLDSKKQAVLYSIFEWPSKPNSKLILVGIANALDLTDRILPRLQARCDMKPKLMPFAPYSKQQIYNIISSRLNEANVADVLTGTAMQLLAGKVAAVSGDIRRALDISRRVVELAEAHKAQQVLQPAVNNESNKGSPKKQQPPCEKPADLKEVMTVLNGVYGGGQNLNKEESTFPLQQKLLLCSLLLIFNKGRNKDVTIGKLHDVYKKVCKKRNIHAVDISEFVSLCSLIESRGVLTITAKKEPRYSKVSLQWDQEELDAGLQDKNMMTEIINDVSCL